MPVQTPYYNIHQLSLGLYTDGNEFVFENGEEYIGMYYATPNGKRFSGGRPEENSKELFVKRIIQTADVIRYNNITTSPYPTYNTPIAVDIIPSIDDYKRGNIQRFFLQKRNSPKNTIIEIDATQFNQVNTTNKPGINGVIWNKVLINWVISKIPITDAEYKNRLEVIKSEQKFPYLFQYLTNYAEFYR